MQIIFNYFYSIGSSKTPASLKVFTTGKSLFFHLFIYSKFFAKEQFFNCCTIWFSLQNGVERAEFLLKQALYEDERGRPDDALPLYTDAAELCIRTVSFLMICFLERYFILILVIFRMNKTMPKKPSSRPLFSLK